MGEGRGLEGTEKKERGGRKSSEKWRQKTKESNGEAWGGGGARRKER